MPVPNYTKYPEYNVAGDSANGMKGTTTPEALQNQNAQPSKAGNANPYEGILRGIQQRRQAMQAQGSPPPSQAPGPMPPSIPIAPRYGPDGKPLPFMGDPGYYAGTPDPNAQQPWMPPSGPGQSLPPSFAGGGAPLPSLPPAPGESLAMYSFGSAAPDIPDASTGATGGPMPADVNYGVPAPQSSTPATSHPATTWPDATPAQHAATTWPDQNPETISSGPGVLKPPPNVPATAKFENNTWTWQVGPNTLTYDPLTGQTSTTYIGSVTPGGGTPTPVPVGTVPGKRHASTPDPTPGQTVVQQPPPSPTSIGDFPSPSGKAYPVGPTGETPAQITSRWRQGLIDKGQGDLAQWVTPGMIAFYRANNPQQLDPVAWMQSPALEAYKKWVIANPNADTLSGTSDLSIGVPPEQYNPSGVIPPGRGNAPVNPHDPYGTGFDPYATQQPSATSPQGTTPIVDPGPSDALLSKLGGTTPPNVAPTTPPPQLPNETGMGPSDALNAKLGGGNGEPTPPATSASVADRIHSLYAPLFQQQQKDLAGNLNAEAAVTGDINAGGFSQGTGPNSFNRQMSNLAAQQGGQEANFLQQANESALGRGVDVYGIQAKMFGDRLTADVQRYGINTNADLERELQQGQLGYQYKALDKNDLLERYKAELAKKGSDYAADRGVDAAALHAAAASAAANASSQAALQEAQLQYSLGTQRLGLEKEQTQNQYNIDQSKLGLEQYMFDTPNINTLLQLYSQMSPEQLSLAAAGTPMFPNYVYQPNAGFNFASLFGGSP